MARITQGPAPEDHYTLIPNSLSRSPDIPPRAKAVYIYLKSHRTGWNITTERVGDALGMSKDTAARAIQDLIDVGYVRRVKLRGDRGQFGGWDYEVLSRPLTVSEKTDYGKTPCPENTDVGKSRGHKKTNSSKKINGEEDQSPCSPPEGDGSPRELSPDHQAPAPQKQSGASSYPQAFEDWWGMYPKKVGKQAALRAWKKACRTVGSGELERALEAHLPSMRSKELRYVPNPATWLNEGRYDDDPPAVQASPKPPASDVMAWFTPAGGAPASQPPTVVDAEIVEQRELGA